MPKRKNPFGDTAPIQLKTHVGFKQAATEADKQEVYGELILQLNHMILFNAHSMVDLYVRGACRLICV